MRRFLLALCYLALVGCDQLDQRGMVMVLDPAYRAEMLGSTADGFTSPDGLRWIGGKLYIADEGGRAVRVWTPGRGLATLADARSGLSSPEDVVVDGSGTIFWSDDNVGGVWRLAPGGQAVQAGKPLMPSTEGIALAPDGAVLIGDARAHRVIRMDKVGRFSVFLGPERGISKPESMAFDDRGDLYIADNKDNVLYLLTRDGRLHRTIHDRPGFSPESILYSGGALYITDSDDGKLYRYTPADGLVPIAMFAGELANVQGIAADEKGNLYVTVQSDLKGGRGYIVRLARL